MNNSIKKYLNKLMISIPGGVRQQDHVEVNDTPVVNVSWYDAISFCNLLSKECGLNECYIFERDGSNVFCDWNADGYRLPTDAEWQHACRAASTGYRYGELEDMERCHHVYEAD